jgi:hypothetical protein
MMNQGCFTICQKKIGQVIIFRNNHSVKLTFGQMTFRTNDRFSEKAYGHMNFRSNEHFSKKAFGQMNFRSYVISVIWSVFQVRFPVKDHFPNIFGQMTF